MSKPLDRLFPFLRWLPMRGADLRADVLAGLTVAMILVPQSMAYAALAGLPVIYGLYAAALPVAVGALWGSSRYLHTGPVAMLSLMSAAAIAPFAVAGTEDFIELSILLALLVGVLRLLMGLFRLGVLMNFTSHPVILGFTNAAALIIGLSLLNTFLAVPMPRSDSFLVDLYAVVRQLPHAHWPTVAFGLVTLAFLLVLRRIAPRAPGVLFAVILGTVVSASMGFEEKLTISIDQVTDPGARQAYGDLLQTRQALAETRAKLSVLAADLRRAKGTGEHLPETEVEVARLTALEGTLERRLESERISAHAHTLEAVDQGQEGVVFRAAEGNGPVWRIASVEGSRLVMSAGGKVVGDIPRGLPSFEVPVMNWEVMPLLIPAALVMALIGFMEATSISRALAAREREKLDANQELIGQGLANIVGSFTHAYVVSGSFSRSAVAARSGSRSGLYAVVSAAVVVLVMLYFTPYLYHLPLAVLAAIVMTAVFGLIDFKALAKAWRIQRNDGLIGAATFMATLLLAPQLATGVLIGIGLASLGFLIGTMRPRAEVLGRRPDGSLAGALTHDLPPLSEDFVAMRFDASLVFINVSFFQEAVMQSVADFPKARAVLVIANGINRIDASGIEAIKALAADLRAGGCTLMFSGLKKQVYDAMERGGLLQELGRRNIFPNKATALEMLTRSTLAELSTARRETPDSPVPTLG